jgi:alpha-tubulin suppressor-like RCC1 family protein
MLLFRSLSGSAVAAALLLSAACGGDASGPSGVPVASVTVTPAQDTVLTGETVQLTATPRDAAGNVLTGLSVSWTSNAPGVASVTQAGVVSGVSVGAATITATIEGVAGIALITVEVLDIDGIWDWTEILSDAAAGVTCRDTGSYVFNQSGAGFSGISEQTGFCTVPFGGIENVALDAVTSGTVSGRSIVFNVGSCVYTANVLGGGPDSLAGGATCGTLTGSWRAVAQQPVESLSVAPAAPTVVLGGTRQLVAQMHDSVGRRVFQRTVTWTSDAPGVVAVSATGGATGAAVGTANVTSSVEGLSASASVTVVTVSFAEVSPGFLHTCARTGAGAAFCWGYNVAGYLGVGAEALRHTSPTPVLGGLTFTAVRAGEAHSCGLVGGGAGYCWGFNDQGRLGDGTLAPVRATPTAVSGVLAFDDILPGVHTCALTSTGAAHCWGWNVVGQLGDGTRTDRAAPVAVTGGLNFSQVSVSTSGLSTCALTGSGAAYCWGYNSDGQVGTGTIDSSGLTSPTAVLGGLTFGAIAAGGLHTCGLTTGNAAYCWGDNVVGQVGDGTTTDRTTPVAVSGGLSFVSMSAGFGHTCALTAGGVAYCWGYNFYGQLGDGSTTSITAPVPVSGGLTFSALRAGTYHTCGITTGGVAYCWGRNDQGQLGDGTQTQRLAPVRVVGQP